MLSKREFLGERFFSFCQQEFDNSRVYLKNCGRPKDGIDVWMIQFHRETVSIFKRFLTN